MSGPTWAEQRVAREPDALEPLFAAAARDASASGLDGDEARARLLLALPGAVDDVAAAVTRVYQRGDTGERLAVLRALPRLDDPSRAAQLGPAVLPVVQDALRSNDPRLVAEAMNGYARAHLGAPAWRHGVVKLVFMGVPVRVVDGLAERADAELARMAEDLATERRRAGRPVPDDVALLAALARTAGEPVDPPDPPDLPHPSRPEET